MRITSLSLLPFLFQHLPGPPPQVDGLLFFDHKYLIYVCMLILCLYMNAYAYIQPAQFVLTVRVHMVLGLTSMHWLIYNGKANL